MAAVVARFTGMNLSMTVLFALLYIGATPVEAVMSMLVFQPVHVLYGVYAAAYFGD